MERGDTAEMDGTALGLAVSPREQLAAISVVSPDEEPRIVLWRPGAGTETTTLSKSGCIGPLTFLRDGKRLAIAYEERVQPEGPHEFVLWDLEGGRVVHPPINPGILHVTGIEVDPTGRLLVCAAHGGVAVYDAASFESKMRVQALSNAAAVGFDLTGERVAL